MLVPLWLAGVAARRLACDLSTVYVSAARAGETAIRATAANVSLVFIFVFS